MEGDFIVENSNTGEQFVVKSEKEAIDAFKKGLQIQNSIDVTPELKAEVEQGLPLFQKALPRKRCHSNPNRFHI